MTHSHRPMGTCLCTHKDLQHYQLAESKHNKWSLRNANEKSNTGAAKVSRDEIEKEMAFRK